MVENENTQLKQDYGLSVQSIEDGDKPEFPAVDKPKKVREPVYLGSLVDPVIDATFADLRDAYLQIRDLNAENTKLKQQNQQMNSQLQTAQKNAQVNANAEKQLQTLEQNVDKMQKDAEERKEAFAKQVQAANEQNKKDAAQIKSLQATVQDQEGQLNSNQSLIDDLNRQVEELQQNGGSEEELKAKEAELEATKESLTNDVNEVLQNLREKFQIE